MADGDENGVCGIAFRSPQTTAVDMTFGSHVTDDGLDSGRARKPALGGAEKWAIANYGRSSMH